ncbi:uncharacterized protein A1O5_10472 [Cladophialophora psammophila CBS 110553]|uniref:Uncharacterized protein n=1 Tax=Cladophialophora psammophila CBS 110553 TaxID=1182543 RepID=W9WMT0_9EURO|nr:uncharacterized protein A1O5_10472 [Cladophialophora psammophila CBS 110553]EXJ66320.1 hypothetical protein A1O5_10472 [Cladophialophora psammophila CBS 110553]
MYIQEIPSRSIPTLAKLLQSRPNEAPEALSRRIAKGVKSLPSFLRPSRLEKLLLPPRGHLCRLHKALHYDVVDIVLHHIQLEVGVRLNNLISQCELLSPEQYVRVMRLRALHALWLTPEDYEKTFLTSSQDSQWSYQNDRCGACILSRITCDLEILLDLRWTIRSRATQYFIATYGNPRLQLWVQVWIAALARRVQKATGQEIDLDAVMLQNEEQAMALKKARASIEAVRKEKYKYMKLSRRKSGRSRAKRDDGSRLVPNPQGLPEHEAARTASLPSKCDHNVEEGLPGEPNEADLEGMDAFEALTSTTYLPSQPHPHVKYTFESDISSVSGDPSMKGQSPYEHASPRSERHSVCSVVDDPQTITSQVLRDDKDEDECLEYVPPRSHWKTPPRQERQTQPPTRYGRSLGNQSHNHQMQPPFMSTDSWETEPCLASSSSIYSSATVASKNQRHPTSRSRQHLSRVDEDEDERSESQSHSRSRIHAPSFTTAHKSLSAVPRRSSADTYTDLLAPSPFTETYEAPPRQQHVPAPGPSAYAPPASASELFLRLYDEISRPAGAGTQRSPRSPSSSVETCTSSATSLSSPEPTFQPSCRPAPAPALSTPPRCPVSSTEAFLNLYDEIVSAYAPTKRPGNTSSSSAKLHPAMSFSSSTLISSTTKKRLTPERLSVRASTGGESRNHHGDGRASETPVTPHSHVHARERAASRSSASHSRSRSRSDVHSTWSRAYESEIASREDLDWFYRGR